MTRRRSGYTLIEVLVVMAILLILGAVVAPSLTSMSRDTNVKAGGDVVRSQAEVARAHAMGSGVPHELSLSPDGTVVRVAPSVLEEDEWVEPGEEPTRYAEETVPPTVRVAPAAVNGDSGSTEDGWVRVMTFLADGTCREDSAAVDVTEPGNYTLRLTIRGLTGTVTATKLSPGEGAAP